MSKNSKLLVFGILFLNQRVFAYEELSAPIFIHAALSGEFGTNAILERNKAGEIVSVLLTDGFSRVPMLFERGDSSKYDANKNIPDLYRRFVIKRPRAGESLDLNPDPSSQVKIEKLTDFEKTKMQQDLEAKFKKDTELDLVKDVIAPLKKAQGLYEEGPKKGEPRLLDLGSLSRQIDGQMGILGQPRIDGIWQFLKKGASGRAQGIKNLAAEVGLQLQKSLPKKMPEVPMVRPEKFSDMPPASPTSAISVVASPKGSSSSSAPRTFAGSARGVVAGLRAAQTPAQASSEDATFRSTVSSEELLSPKSGSGAFSGAPSVGPLSPASPSSSDPLLPVSQVVPEASRSAASGLLSPVPSAGAPPRTRVLPEGVSEPEKAPGEVVRQSHRPSRLTPIGGATAATPLPLPALRSDAPQSIVPSSGPVSLSSESSEPAKSLSEPSQGPARVSGPMSLSALVMQQGPPRGALPAIAPRPNAIALAVESPSSAPTTSAAEGYGPPRTIAPQLDAPVEERRPRAPKPIVDPEEVVLEEPTSADEQQPPQMPATSSLGDLLRGAGIGDGQPVNRFSAIVDNSDSAILPSAGRAHQDMLPSVAHGQRLASESRVPRPAVGAASVAPIRPQEAHRGGLRLPGLARREAHVGSSESGGDEGERVFTTRRRSSVARPGSKPV